MLESYPDSPYVLSIGAQGDVNVIKGTEIVFSGNIYDDLTNKWEINNIEIGNIYWSKDYRDLIILIKENKMNDKLVAIKKINLQDKSIITVVEDIAGSYDHLFIESKLLIAVYTENNKEKVSLVIHNLLNDKKKIIVEDADAEYYGYIRNMQLEFYENFEGYDGTRKEYIEDDFIE